MSKQATIPVPLEVDIQRAVVLAAAARGIKLWRNNSRVLRVRGRKGRQRLMRVGLGKGSADLVGMLPGGRLIAVEVKRPGEVPRPEQWAFLEEVRLWGGVGCFARSAEDIEVILDVLLAPAGSMLTIRIDPATMDQFADEKPPMPGPFAPKEG